MAKAERLSPACAPQSACVERLAKPSAGAGSERPALLREVLSLLG